MPPLTLPEGVPLGLGWYLLWISVYGLFIYIFQKLSSPHSQSKEKAENNTKDNLFELNTYLHEISGNKGFSWERPLASVEDLRILLKRVKRAYKPMTRYNNLQNQTAWGKYVCISGIVVAVILAVMYYFEKPSIEDVTLISYIGAGIMGAWFLWHLVCSIVYYRLNVRMSDEEA